MTQSPDERGSDPASQSAIDMWGWRDLNFLPRVAWQTGSRGGVRALASEPCGSSHGASVNRMEQSGPSADIQVPSWRRGGRRRNPALVIFGLTERGCGDHSPEDFHPV